MKTIKGCEYIVRLLKEKEITHVFYMEGMLRMTNREMQKSGIKPVLAHSEIAAVYMADGYARASGKAGVCMAQSIGAANMAAGLQEAWLANSPVIALTGRKLDFQQYKNSYQETEHKEMYNPVTKFNADVTSPDMLPYLLRQSFREALTGKPKPVHLDMPNRMGRTTENAVIADDLPADNGYKTYPANRPPADEASIRAAVSAISAAEKPIMILGGGARMSDAGGEAYKLARKADIPIAITVDGKALIDERCDLYVGVVGGYSMECANRAASAADLVIYVGSQTNDQATLDWQIPKLTAKVVQIDLDPAELGRNYPDTVGLLGDAKTVLAQLLRKTEATERPAWREETKSYVRDTYAKYEELLTDTRIPVNPARLCREIEKNLPEDAILVADTGYSSNWTAIMIRMNSRQRYYRAAGSLGWGFPGALGIKCAHPDRSVICFTGDGAFYYHMAEMETAVRNNIKLITVINNNNVFAQGIQDTREVFTGIEQPAVAENLFQFTAPDFSKIAGEFGLYSERVEKPEEIGAAIERAIAADRPAVIEVMTSAEVFMPPVWSPVAK